MGASCCGGESKQDIDKNLTERGQRRGPPKMDDQFVKTLPIFTVIKV